MAYVAEKLKALLISSDDSLSDALSNTLANLAPSSVERHKPSDPGNLNGTTARLLSFDLIVVDGETADEREAEALCTICTEAPHPPVLVVTEEKVESPYRQPGQVVGSHETGGAGSTIPALLERELIRDPVLASRVALAGWNPALDASLDSYPGPAAVCDLAGRPVRWNEDFARLCGQLAKEAGDVGFLELLAPQSLEEYRKRIGELAQPGSTEAVFEADLARRAGAVCQATFRMKAITDKSGKALGFFLSQALEKETKRAEEDVLTLLKRAAEVADERAGILLKLNERLNREVEERRRAERELWASRNFLNSILENTLDLVLVFDPGGSLVYANPAVKRILGRDARELDGANILDIVHPDDRNAIVSLWKNILEEGKAEAPVECRMLDEQGSWKALEILGVSFEDREGEKRIIANARDITEKRQAQEKLAKTTETLRAFLDATSEYAVLLDREKKVVAANRVLAERLGLSVDELRGLKLYESGLFDDDVAMLRSQKVSEAFETAKPVFFTDYHRGKYFEHRIYPVFDAPGEASMVAFFSTDITERKAFEDEIRKFETITEKANFGIAMCDINGRVIYANPYFARIHGYEPEEVKGKGVTVFHNEDQLPKVLELLEKIAREGSFSSEEVWHARRDGSVFPMLMNGILIRNEDGSPRFLAATAIDITEMKKAADELAESEEKYRLLFENSFDVIFSIDRSFRIDSISPSIQAASGYTPEEVIGVPFADLPVFTGDSVKRVIDDVLRVFNGEKVASSYDLIAKDGSRRVAEITMAPVYKGGSISRTVAVGRDVTERKKFEEELLKLTAELDSYAETVSHDLKSPLSAIRLAAENLQKVWGLKERMSPEELDAEVKRSAEIVGEAVSKATALIDDLLALARAKQKPEFVALVDVKEIIDDVLRDLSGLIGSRNAEVKVSANLGHVRANPSHLYQLFSNLIDNAIRHNTSAKPAVSVAYHGLDRAGFHRYVIRDNGSGLPREMARKAFMPFTRGKTGRTGIGLSIVEKIVNVYGGEIRVRNRKGAVFELTLRDWTDGSAD